MKKVIFPQPGQAPEIIKEKVMAYVATDISTTKSLVKRAGLVKILLPNFALLFLVVGAFYLTSFLSDTSSSLSPIVSQVVPPTRAVVIARLETKLDETEKLLNELDNLQDI